MEPRRDIQRKLQHGPHMDLNLELDETEEQRIKNQEAGKIRESLPKPERLGTNRIYLTDGK